MASPITAGLAAMVLAVHPELTPLQLRQRIMDTTDYIYDVNSDLDGMLGTGRVNAFTAAMYDLIPKLTIEEFHLEEVQGNGDGIPNPGEEINFTMLLQNQYFTYGFWAPATNVIAHFSTDNPGITLTNTDVNFGDIGQVGSAWNTNSPLIITSEEDLTNLTIPLHIVIEANQDAEYPYHQEYDINVHLSMMQQGWPVEIGGASESAPTIVDLDNDGQNEVVFGTANGKLYAVNGLGQNISGFPVENLGSSVKTVAIDDINNDGYPEIVSVTASGILTVTDKDGQQVWQQNLSQMVRVNPIIVTINGDKKIIVACQTNKIFVFNSDGTNFENYPIDTDAGTFLAPAIGDLNQDGNLDLMVFASNRNLHAITIASGEELPGWPVSLSSSSVSGGILFTQINNSPALMLPLSTKVIALDSSGNFIFTKDLETDQTRGEIVSGDINGDGIKDYVFNVFSGKAYAIDSQGNTLENFPIEMSFNIDSSPILVDMNQDGTSEILFGDNEGFFNSLDYTGTQTPNFPVDAISAIKNAAAIGDIDNDGDPEIVFANQTSFYALDIRNVASVISWPTYRENNRRWGNDTVAPSSSDNDNIAQLQSNLGSAYPNPFITSKNKSDISIRYYLNESQNVKIEIYNIKGQKVNTIENNYQESGNHIVKWNLTNYHGQKVSSGIYLYRMITPKKVYTNKLVILK